MSYKYLPSRHDPCERDGAVMSPLLGGGDVVDEDDKVVGLAVVEDFGDLVVSARHFNVCGGR